MRLTTYTDYALRTLMDLAVNRDRRVSIQDIASLPGIPKNPLTKVVHPLGQLGMVTTVRGRNGGLKLGWEPADINIGAVVRQTETDFHMAECFDGNNNHCVFASACVLEDVLGTATAAYLKVLDGVCLADLVKKPAGRTGKSVVGQPLQFHAKLPSAD